MVIGNGLVAKGFSAYNRDSNIVVFASGVSNSTTTSEAAFSREAGLLSEILRQHTEKKIVYISTCSIYDESLNDSAYVRHKLAMAKRATPIPFLISFTSISGISNLSNSGRRLTGTLLTLRMLLPLQDIL